LRTGHSINYTWMMVKSPQHPLRMTLLILTSILVSLTWISTFREAYKMGKVYRIAQRTTTTNVQIDKLLQAGQNLAFERGRTFVVLDGTAGVDPENRLFIDKKRLAIEEHLVAALADPAIRDMLAAHQVEAEYQELKKLRVTIDAALEKNGPRDKDLAARWFDSSSALLRKIGQFASEISSNADPGTQSLRIYGRMKIIAFELRNSLGIESARIAASVSGGHVMTALELEDIQELRGMSNELWEAISREKKLANNDRISLALDSVNLKFFINYRVLLNSALDSFRDGKTSAITIQRILAASEPALDSLAALMSLLTEETKIGAENYLDSAGMTFLRALGVALLSAVIGALVLLTVIYRLFVPLKIIEDQLNRLSRGDLSPGVRSVGRRDEMTKTYDAVMAFRESLIARRKLEEQLVRLSNKDGLTGLANRRCLDDRLNGEWHRARRAGSPIAIIMFDVDFFKKYNDRYGHLAGDECLKAIARELASHTRRSGDMAARFGGEEFVVILPDLTMEQAGEWAEESRMAIERLAIPHEDSPTGTITVSAGVASVIPGPDDSGLELIRVADDNLYSAKARGRNCIVAGQAPTSLS
jgi:diguanylate cyclase (GGDEF)-like protein